MSRRLACCILVTVKLVGNRVRSLCDGARAHAVELARDSPCRLAATDTWFSELKRDNPPDIPPTRLPNLLMHLFRLSVEQLRAFDNDVAAVKAASPYPQRVEAFIATGTRNDHESTRQWFAGRAEIAVLASLIEYVPADRLHIEPTLPNGKVADAKVLIEGRWVWIEITALTGSDTAYAADQPDESVQIHYGDPYKDAQRMYRKAFDKIAGREDQPRGQLHPTEPSILIIANGDSGVGFSSPGIEWAVGQTLHPDTREPRTPASLLDWAEHDYPTSDQDALAQIDHLSGIALYSYGLHLLSFEENAAPDDAHRLTETEVAAINGLLRINRHWTSESARP